MSCFPVLTLPEFPESACQNFRNPQFGNLQSPPHPIECPQLKEKQNWRRERDSNPPVPFPVQWFSSSTVGSEWLGTFLLYSYFQRVTNRSISSVLLGDASF